MPTPHLTVTYAPAAATGAALLAYLAGLALIERSARYVPPPGLEHTLVVGAMIGVVAAVVALMFVLMPACGVGLLQLAYGLIKRQRHTILSGLLTVLLGAGFWMAISHGCYLDP